MSAAALLLVGLLVVLTGLELVVRRLAPAAKPTPPKSSFAELRERGWVLYESASEIPLQLALF